MTEMNRAKLVKAHQRITTKALKVIRSQRTYKIPKGYCQWDDLSGVIAMKTSYYLAIESGQIKQVAADDISRSSAWQSALWSGQKAPLYLIESDLLKAFQNSEVIEKKELLADLEFALPTFALLIPKGAVFTPRGDEVDYLLVHGIDKRYPQNSEGTIMNCRIEQIDAGASKNIRFSSMDKSGCTWSSAFGLEDGEIECKSKDSALSMDPKNVKFLHSLRSIVLQTLLTLQYRQDLLEPLPDDAPGTPHKKRDGRKVLVPRILGKQYRISRDLGGTHSSPCSHWKSGHWRRVCVGKGREGREWRWFEPVFVNGHKDKQEDVAA